MLTVDEALAAVAEQTLPKSPAKIAVLQSLGLTLAEDIASDIDSPPHDKSIVDGYAVVAGDLAAGEACLQILEEVVAGAIPSQRVVSGAATRIMTGAPLPAGADAVVMVEQTEILPGEQKSLGEVRIRTAKISSGQNIMRRGVSLKQGETVLRAGQILRPIEIGLLSEVGRAEVEVVPRPTVAVLPTGDELVAPGERPGPGQIRNSNGPMLLALVERARGVAVDLGVGRDNVQALQTKILEGLRADVLVLSGGVSAGVLDLAPRVLSELGVRQVFHKIRLKPGKPLWFGVYEAGQDRTLVFGLPGNPVSSLVCFELFVRPALARLAGREFAGLAVVRASLGAEFAHRGERPTYHPAVLEQTSSGPIAQPLRWQGSADLRTLSTANALLHFPPGDRMYSAGEPIEAYSLD